MPTPPASVMLAAGGTGGHLFPAFALAQELARRDILVDLITDLRGDKYGSDFPARQIYRVPAATLKGSSPIAAAKTGYTLTRGTAAAFKLLGEVKPTGGHRLWRLSDVSAAARREASPHSVSAARAERRARPRQQNAGQARDGNRDLVRQRRRH